MSDRASTVTYRDRGRARSKRSGLIRGAKGLLAGALVAGLIVTGATPAVANIGGGGVGGGGGNSGPADYFSLFTGDFLDANGTPTLWGQASTDAFASAMEQSMYWASAMQGRTGINTACNAAMNQAIARSNGASNRARVVQVGVSVDTQNGNWYMGWGGTQTDMRNWYTAQTNANYWQPMLPNYPGSLLQGIYDTFYASIGETPRVVCVALNDSEVANYTLELSTDKNTPFTLAGSTAAVSDRIHTSRSGSNISENVTASVTLVWGGVEGNSRRVTKSVAVPNLGTRNSPNFVPSDFGWASWPSGKFWFDVNVAKQGRMRAAASHAGVNDPRENWNAAPTPPRKILTSGPTADEMAPDEVLASGMFYSAEITARTNGYTSSMTITDTIQTEQVWIGSQTADVASSAYLRDPKGNRVADANSRIDITRAGGSVTVAGTVTGIPNEHQAQEYTLVVPTYVRPTTADYTISDDSKVCYTAAQTACIAGNSKATRKVTPSPDKVWVIDENGALTAADPGKTNQAGVDEKVFAPGAGIGAVVNGAVPAKLAENLSTYALIDDWSAASKYIDFTDASKVRVYADGVDVTGQFTIAIANGKTTATAKPEFLSTTKGLAQEKSTKLYIGGTFRLDYSTDGMVERLTNSGSETLNNQTVATNTPAVYTVTPSPDKAWVLDEDGALTTVDKDKTNTVGADGKIFLPKDYVSAVVNGSIPAGLGSALTSYSVTDDWTAASKYVDFSDPTKAKVFYNGVDVTSGFDVNVVGTKTIASAKAPFLAATKGLAKAGAVKLYISGVFRDDIDTNGELVRLTNSGAESWNGKEVATNSPPVFVWSPDPNKQVLGSAEESGSKAHDDIDGASVWPGQKLEYRVGIDLRVPAGTARGVKSLAVEDAHDPFFEVDKDSVEFWDSRDAQGPKPVPRSAYELRFDDAANTFTATFTDEWIAKNIGADGANDRWLSQGWLTMRVTGTVSPTIAAGSTVTNQAFQIINGARTATEIPKIEIPTVTPDKDSLSTDELDIDGKTLVKGDVVLYRLTLDGGPSRDKLAYNVHKLGIVDDFDEEFLSLEESDIVVTEKATGKDVTGKFNVQIKDGIAYVFAKTVDTAGVYGGIIPGDPQPEDLAAFDAAPIRPLEDPIIDQALLGQLYNVNLRATVVKERDGYVIENQARQNVQNVQTTTRIVSNPIKDIDPTKDAVISEETKDDSIEGTEVRMNTVFNYRLNSSEIPADRAYAAKTWTISDTFDRVHDQYTGVWAIYANTDVFNGTEKIFEKGALLQNSAGHESVPWEGLFDVAFDEETYTFTATATKKYLDLVGSRPDLANAFSVYTKMVRVAPGEDIVNQATETYNGVDRPTNEVDTFTIEYPSVALEKFTHEEGREAGLHRNAEGAYILSDVQLADVEQDEDAATGLSGTKVQKGVDVGIRFENTGDVPLKEVTLTDVTHDGLYGDLEGLVCAVPADPTAPGAIIGNEPVTPDENGMVWVLPASITELTVGQVVDCRGTLRGMKPGMTHGDTAVVTGKSIFTDTVVKASDTWYAKAISTPGIEIIEYTFEEGREKGDRNTAPEALVLTPAQAANGVRVGFDVTNTGDEPLSALDIVAATSDGFNGTVNGITWYEPVKEPAHEQAPAAAKEGEEAPEEEAQPAPETVELNGLQYVKRSLDELTDLEVGGTALLIGTLAGVKEDSSHRSEVAITAEGTYSGTAVSDDDPWNARLPLQPRAGAVTGEGITSEDSRSSLLGGAAMLLAAAAVVAEIMRRRQRARQAR